MRPVRRVGLGLLVTVAAGAALAGSASAALPEWGRCVHAAIAKTGEYAGAKCTIRAPGKGEYNWIPEPSAKPKFSGVGEKVGLETPGKLVITCGASTFEGSYTGPKTLSGVLTLIGCVRSSSTSQQKCQTTPAQEAQIEAKVEGQIGFILGGEKPVVGLDLKPQAPSTTFATFQCGKAPETGPAGSIEGSVIGPIKPNNLMSSEFKAIYKVTAGKQAVEHFEGGPNDTLTVKLLSETGSKTEPIGLRMILTDTNEETAEIKAI